jgi:hypothetical protein
LKARARWREQKDQQTNKQKIKKLNQNKIKKEETGSE